MDFCPGFALRPSLLLPAVQAQQQEQQQQQEGQEGAAAAAGKEEEQGQGGQGAEGPPPLKKVPDGWSYQVRAPADIPRQNIRENLRL